MYGDSIESTALPTMSTRFRAATTFFRARKATFRSSSALPNVRAQIEGELSAIRDAGTYKTERVITSRQAATIGVRGRENKVLNFCANNYLGLSAHPDVIQAGKDALDTHGAGLSSVRFICGTQVFN